MTVIVASLFLPYTVEFQVDSTAIDPNADILVEHTDPSTVESRSNMALKGSEDSLLASMSSANLVEDFSQQNYQQLKSLPKDDGSPENFFQAGRRFPTTNAPLIDDETPVLYEGTEASLQALKPPILRTSSSISLFQDEPRAPSPALGNPPQFLSKQNSYPSSRNIQLTTPGYVQPRSKVNSLADKSSVSELKKYKETPAFSSLKFSRSNTTSTSKLINKIKKEDLNEYFESTISDSSTSSLVPSTKFAPFGGFSTSPDELLCNDEEFFANAPWKVVEFSKGNGSLRNAIRIARQQLQVVDQISWVGTLGIPVDDLPLSTRNNVTDTLARGFHSNVIYVNDETFTGHYNSYCKQILWPTLHYEVPDNPKSKAFEDHSWEYYKIVNQAFADKIVQKYKEGDYVWIHDYHLMLVPQMVREKLPNAKIGFFLHVTFPSSEIFRCFAHRKELLIGILGANCVTLQIEEYVRHFSQTCNRLLLADYSNDGIKYNGRITKINHSAIGIEVDSLIRRVSTSRVTDWRDKVRNRWHDKNLLVTRDKLDKLRGVKQKLLAYEKFLSNYPSFIDNTILILICLPSGNEDDDLEVDILSIVESINSKNHNISNEKLVVYLNQDVDFDQYLALLSEADGFIVSSMREGMNLTSHEFIVANNEKHSPLILSEFTGSASIFADDALLINPWDINQVSQSFYHALTMGKSEKLRRWTSMYQTVLKHDSQNWIKTCLESIDNAWNNEIKRSNESISYFSQPLFDKFYNSSRNGKRLFIINLGKLASVITLEGTTNAKVIPVSLPRIFEVLTKLSSDPSNLLYVMSYFKRSQLTRRYKNFPDIGLIAENGGYVKLHNSNEWNSLVSDSAQNWMKPVIDVVESFCVRLPDCSYEIEDCTVRLHTQNVTGVDQEHKLAMIGDFISHVNDLFSNINTHATLVGDIVVIQEADLVKRALSFVLSRHETHFENRVHNEAISDESSSSVKLMMVIGGCTQVDEEMFRYSKEMYNEGKCGSYLSVKVGRSRSSDAQTCIEGVNELFNILSNFEI
ncbi:hypothetical protein LJB42_004679 [Komagataella kurtzmanii]|nr:hypothetical protein LJB42_004679 [Komagataella kurtzmanii]